MELIEQILSDRNLTEACREVIRNRGASGIDSMSGWLRNRIRYCIWHHWNKTERKRKNLIRLGIDPAAACQWSRSRMGGCLATAGQIPMLGTTITVERLKKRSYISLIDCYSQVSFG